VTGAPAAALIKRGKEGRKMEFKENKGDFKGRMKRGKSLNAKTGKPPEKGYMKVNHSEQTGPMFIRLDPKEKMSKKERLRRRRECEK
jgi:hypothetical protein